MAATFISALEPTIAEQIRRLGVPRTYPARSYIFYEGDPSSGVFVVDSGMLRIDRSTRQGRVVLLDLAVRDALIGELSVIDEEPRSATLSTVTDATIRLIPAQAFREALGKDPTIQDAVMKRLTKRIRSLSTQLLETSTQNASARVAACLLRLVEIHDATEARDRAPGAPVNLKLPINQEELGQWAGLTREGTVMGLRTLRSIGLLDTGRMRVIIHDVAALEDHTTAS